MLKKLSQKLKAAGLDIHGAELYYGGGISRLGSCDVRFPVYSITKSLTSAAFMLACDDGLLTPETPLAELLEARYRPLITEQFAALPFRRFLTMSAGRFPFRPEGDDWTRYILTLGTDHSDCGFHYSNIPAYLVGAALENAFGRELIGVLNERIFDPLGIPLPPCQKSPEGHFYGATGMELSADELLRLGLMFMNGGEWNGSRLISREAVANASAPYIETGSGDSYAFFFRTDGVCFSMRGKWGQQCIISPDRGTVLTYLSHTPDRADELHAVMRGFITELG